MKTFFRSFASSLTRPSYYTDVLHTRIKFSIKYYVVLSSLLILVSTATGTINYTSSVKNDLTKTAKEVVQDFPHDLVITISAKGVTANKSFPLIAKMPSVLILRSGEGFKNLAVIDPNGEISALKKYDSLMLINNSFVIVNDGDSIQTTSLKEFPETRVDYPTMQQLAQTLLFVEQHATFFTAGFFVLTGLFDFFVWRLVYLVISSVGLWLAYKSLVGSYSKAFQISLHSITLPLLISTTLEIAGIDIPFPAWFIIIHAIFTFSMLSRLEKQP